MPPFTVFAKERQKGLQAIDDAAEIDCEPKVPIRVGDPFERALNAHSGVVDEDVKFAEHTLGLVGGRGHRCAIGHIEAYGLDASELATLLERRQCIIDVILAQVCEHDAHARGNECCGDAEPDAAGAPGDECGPSCDDFHFAAPTTRIFRERHYCALWRG